MNIFQSIFCLIFLYFGFCKLFSQQVNDCDSLQFISTGMGDGKLQWFAPIKHIVKMDSLMIELIGDKKVNKDESYFQVNSVNWKWDCNQKQGVIIMSLTKKIIAQDNPLDIKFVDATYTIDFFVEPPEITLKYDDNPMIYFSGVEIKEQDAVTNILKY